MTNEPVPIISSAVRPEMPPLTTPRPLLVNVAQAAQTLCVSRSSIYQLIWTDQLVPIRIGRSVRFSIEQLERFVAERTLAETEPEFPDTA